MLTGVREQCAVEFHGDRGGTAPLTWAQQYIFDVVESLADRGSHLNFHVRVDVPDGAPVDAVLSALRRLVERNEVLRTRFYRDGEGQPAQHVMATGSFLVDVLDIGPDAAIDAVSEEIQRLDVAFPEPDWPLRALLAVAGDTPRAVFLVVGHAAVDLAASRLLSDDLSALVAGRTPPVLGRPLDRVAFEATPGGQGIGERAIARMRADLQSAPPTLFPAAFGEARHPRYWIGRLDSLVGGVAALGVARRLGVDPPAVVLGLLAIVVGLRAGTTRPAFLVIAENRTTPEQARFAGQLAQFTSVAVGLADPSVSAVIREADRALREANENGQYPPAALDDLLCRLGAERAVTLDLTTTLNYHRSEPAVPDVPDPEFQSFVDAHRSSSTFAWTSKLELENYKLYMDAWLDTELHLGMRVDTRYLPPAETEAILRGMEQSLVRLATGDITVADVGRATGVPASVAAR